MVKKPIRDTFFLDSKRALKQAKKQKTLTVTEKPLPWSIFNTDIATQKRQIFYNDLQICYYVGEKLEIDNTPENFINVPFDKVFDFFKETRLRYPEVINFKGIDLSDSEKENIIKLFIQTLQNANGYKNEKVQEYINIIKNNKPNFNEPLRFFFMANRHTTVMQYVSRNICNSLRKLGYEVYFSIEDNLMESISMSSHLYEFATFNPHVTININHLNNQFLNNHIFNFVWFQDPMPILMDNSKIQLRNRDKIFTLDKIIMKKFREEDYELRSFCVNKDEFFKDKSIARRNKIIFIGSSYQDMVKSYPDANMYKVYKKLKERLDNGKGYTRKYLNKLVHNYNLPYDDIVFKALSPAVRESCVEWICKQNKVDVEVYGRFWDHNNIIKPYFKGELKHGSEVREAYCSAKYALLAHPIDMYQQRLPEIAACGTIPVSFDAGELMEVKYKYKDESLLFSSFKTLLKIFGKKPDGNVSKISRELSYENFSNRILQIIKQDL